MGGVGSSHQKVVKVDLYEVQIRTEPIHHSFDFHSVKELAGWKYCFFST